MGQQMSALEKARKAAVEYKRQRALHEKKVTTAAGKFFRADAKLEAARQRVEDAEDARAAAIIDMLDLGESITTIAGLCGITDADVRVLQRRGRTTPQSGSDNSQNEQETESIDTSVSDSPTNSTDHDNAEG